MEEQNIKSQILNQEASSCNIVNESKVDNENINNNEKNKEIHNESIQHNDTSKKITSEISDCSTKDFTLEDIFINLTLIARIEVGNKLVRSDKYVNIDTSYFQFITRWFNSQNRTDSIRFTANILSKAFEYSDNLSKQKDDESRQNLLRLNTALSNAVNGLSNLSQTYHYDKLTQSEIDVMINNIRTKLNIQSKHIQFVDEKIIKDEYRNQVELKDDKHKNETKRDIMTEIKNVVLDNIKRDKKDDRKEHKDHRDHYDTRDKDRDSRDHKDNNREDHHSQHHSSHLKKKSL